MRQGKQLWNGYCDGVMILGCTYIWRFRVRSRREFGGGSHRGTGDCPSPLAPAMGGRGLRLARPGPLGGPLLAMVVEFDQRHLLTGSRGHGLAFC